MAVQDEVASSVYVLIPWTMECVVTMLLGCSAARLADGSDCAPANLTEVGCSRWHVFASMRIYMAAAR